MMINRKCIPYNHSRGFRLLAMVFVAIVVVAAGTSCSSTSALKEGEQLFTGLKKIEYTDYEPGGYADSTILEMESVLASAPNGALFGSSYYRTPFPVRLWVWNAFSQSDGAIAKWITKAFGSRPKLMGNVNPRLRAQVAENQLAKYGYFHGKVNYEILTQKNPKKAKLAYHVSLGPLMTIDTLQNVNFPSVVSALIDSTRQEALVHTGSPFNVPRLEGERQRLTRLFRNNGYYFYQNGYVSYLADTLDVPGKASMKMIMADSLDSQVTRQWYLGNININFRKQFTEELTDSFCRRYLNIRYHGKKMPIRAGVVLRDLNLRPRQLYRVENEEKARQHLQSMGVFNYTSLQFTPRDTTAQCDTLDATLDLIFDKPYDFYIETNVKGKTTGRVGPELVVGFTKRNAFRGGEKLDINLHGSYEWQTGEKGNGASSNHINSYEYGTDVSLSFPSIVTPFNLFTTMAQRERRFRKGHIPRSFYGVPSTTVKASMNVLNRAGYFRRHVVSGELTYDWATSAKHRHSFSPLVLSYEFMNSRTAAFDEAISESPYLQIAMRDQFVPKMSYTYTYTSPAKYRHPIIWSTTVSEAGNILSLGYLCTGKKWNDEDKEMFRNPYSQFLKLESDFVKYWRIAEHSTLVGHLNAGVVWSYGNSEKAPYYEQFYIGGANSVRAFNVRSIGPGQYLPTGSKYSYIDQTGDIKFLANIEYRPRIWGDLYGALFFDAGNVWTLRSEEHSPQGQFKFRKFFTQMAVGTGVGVRYDMGMFVIRVDWGVGLHVPYETSKKGFYNIDSFKNSHSLHLTVGYPF